MSDVGKRLDLLGAKKLENGDFSYLSPVLAVRTEGDVEVVVGEPTGSFGERSAAALEVVGFEDVFGEVRGGDYDGGDVAELDVEDGAVGFGHFLEGSVVEFVELVEVSDDGKAWWARWVVWVFSFGFDEEEDCE